jgi:CubicO group peptidase (beta-lactamase class C family)
MAKTVDSASSAIVELQHDETAMHGCDREAVNRAWVTLVAAANRHEFGGAVALVVVGRRIVLHRATGWAVREPESLRTPMAADTIFDLASLTKVTATTPAILQLVSAGRIGLDQPIGEILDEFGTDGPIGRVTIRRLMSHSAGFRDWIPVFLEARGADAYLRAFAETQPELEPGAQIVYSDPGFITLGEVVRRVTGESVADYAWREVFQPLGMTDTRYTPPAQIRNRIAATECGNDFEAEKAPEKVPAVGAWRTGLIRGQVHDGNAWYGFGGIAGHAGLFGTAIDLARYGCAWLTGTVPGIDPEVLRQATTEQSGVKGTTERRGLGWRLTAVPNDDPEDSGLGFGARAYGHTGFTGTSLWMDPDRDLVVVLLTNRVHPTVTTQYMRTRAAFDAAIAGAMR